MSSVEVEQVRRYYTNIVRMLSTAVMKAVTALSLNDSEKLREAIRDLENISSIVESPELCELLNYLKKRLGEVSEDLVEKAVRKVREEVLPKLLQELDSRKIELRPVERIVKVDDIAFVEFTDDGRVVVYLIET